MPTYLCPYNRATNPPPTPPKKLRQKARIPIIYVNTNTGGTQQTASNATNAHHLSVGEFRWQILTLIPGSYNPPYKAIYPKIIEWRKMISKQVEDTIIHEEDWNKSFYNKL